MAIVAGILVSAVLVPALDGQASWVFIAALMAVAAVGYVDDRRGLSVAARLGCHFMAATVCVLSIPTPERVLEVTALAPVMPVLLIVGVVWSVNLFNFMDGIDGLASSQAVFVLGSAALLSGSGAAATGFMLASAAACLGFLVWNWPPARIFMGDAGSGALGLHLGVLAVASAASGELSVWTWVILHGVFIVDATTTLLVRAWLRRPLGDAHRSHAYQHAARASSHAHVIAAILSIEIGWLLPGAYVVERGLIPGYLGAAIALTPILYACWKFRAGRE